MDLHYMFLIIKWQPNWQIYICICMIWNRFLCELNTYWGLAYFQYFLKKKYFYFNERLSHHPLTNKMSRLKLITICYCILKTKRHVQLKSIGGKTNPIDWCLGLMIKNTIIRNRHHILKLYKKNLCSIYAFLYTFFFSFLLKKKLVHKFFNYYYLPPQIFWMCQKSQYLNIII